MLSVQYISSSDLVQSTHYRTHITTPVAAAYKSNTLKRPETTHLGSPFHPSASQYTLKQTHARGTESSSLVSHPNCHHLLAPNWQDVAPVLHTHCAVCNAYSPPCSYPLPPFLSPPFPSLFPITSSLQYNSPTP